MQFIHCDVCRKKVDPPISDRTVFYFGETEMCEPCRDALELLLKPTVRRKEPFAMDWYRNLILDSCEKGVQKGRM